MIGQFSWNLVADLRDMWSLPSMVSAFRAGTVVAVLAALVGWFMVLRGQSFVGHTLSVVGFPGASAAVWLSLPVAAGYFGFCLAAAVLIAARPVRTDRRYREEPVLVGTVQALALAAGGLFAALAGTFLSGTTALLFGSFLGITSGQVLLLLVVAVAVLAVLAACARPLRFASVDAGVARAHGVPVRALDAVFLVLLGATAAEVSQITGALLVFALLVLPAATAARLTARTGLGLLLSVVIGLVTVWLALTVAYYANYPIGFWLTGIAFAGYLLATAGRAASGRWRARRTAPPAARPAGSSA